MTTSPPPSDPAGDGDHLVVAEHIQTALSGHVEPHGLLVVDVDALSGRHVALVGGEQFCTNQNFTSWLCCMKSQRATDQLLEQLFLHRSKGQRGGSGTFLTSRVSMQRSKRSTVEMSMYSLHMSFIHLVKLSTVVLDSTQVNLMMLNTRLMMLSEGGKTTGRRRRSVTWQIFYFNSSLSVQSVEIQV